MKKSLKTTFAVCLFMTISIFAHTQNSSLVNNWNTPTLHPFNSIMDSKVNPGDGIYTIEENVILVPYVQGGDTLYGTQDSCTFLKKFSFQGTLLWDIAFPTVTVFNGTMGEPGKIEVLSDGILLLCSWGITKYTFDGIELFGRVYPQSSFDLNGFFGGGPDLDYFWNDVFQNNGATITLGHISYCDSICYTTDYVFTWIGPTGTIIDSLKINRNVEMSFVQQNGYLYFAYLQNGSIRIEKVNLQTKVVSFVIDCPYGPFGLWDINKLISLHKTTKGFRLVTSNIKDWDWIYNSTHTPTNYFVEVDTILNTMIVDVHVQNNTKLKPCLDEWTSTIQVGDTLYVSTEDAKLVKWDYAHQIHVFDLLESAERIYGTARIALFGDNLLYVTNDSILTTIDSIVGNFTYTTQHKAAVIRVLDMNLNVLAKDSLPDYAINQYDLAAIDETSFIFSGWWNTHPSVLSSWTFNQTTIGINKQPTPKKTDFNVYPNPCTTVLNVSTENPCTIVIYDITGREVGGAILEKENSIINVSEWPKGIYMIKGSQGGSTKIIKQ
ncbi:MAG: T9SS type A sorting domain-containing protein [bacterium]